LSLSPAPRSSSPAIAARPSRLILVTVATLVAPGLARTASAAGPVPPAPRPLGSLQDDAGLLGRGPEVATLRDRVVGAATRAGLPLSIVVVGTTDPASLGEAARTRFAEEGLSEGTNDAVLLLVAPRAGQAAIETGKDEAGIVPEIDARRITAALTRTIGRHPSAATLGRALAETADQIADSALATRDRRRPLADRRTGAVEDDEAPAPSSRRDPAAPTAGGDAREPGAPRRSLMPGAYALAIFVILGLALRQRRRSGADGRPRAPRRP